MLAKYCTKDGALLVPLKEISYNPMTGEKIETEVPHFMVCQKCDVYYDDHIHKCWCGKEVNGEVHSHRFGKLAKCVICNHYLQPNDMM